MYAEIEAVINVRMCLSKTKSCKYVAVHTHDYYAFEIVYYALGNAPKFYLLSSQLILELFSSKL